MYVNVSGFVGLVIVVGLVCIQYHAKETEELKEEVRVSLLSLGDVRVV